MDRRKIENAALVLPIFGSVLMLPPILSVFEVHVQVFGVPLEIVYLFAVWIGLIVATKFLADSVIDHTIEAPPPAPTPEKQADD